MKTPLTYYGGKQRMLKFILPLIPEHDSYCEPFIGGGAVFWAKKEARVETINDAKKDIVTFYEVLKGGHNKMFYRYIDQSLMSRYQHNKAYRIYHRIKKRPSRAEIAWAVWYLGNLSFNGDFDGRIKFSRNPERSYRFLTNGKDRILDPKMIKRLEKTQIDCRDALDVIPLMDSVETFMYVDPPYVKSDQGHYGGYTKKDFTNLLDELALFKGKFLLSSYPSKLLDEYVEKYGWNTMKIKMSSSAAVLHGHRSAKTEVLTYNYPTDFDRQLDFFNNG